MNNNFKARLLGVVKVISFILANLLMQKLVFIPLSAISVKYWSQYDGRGLNEPWFLASSISILIVAIIITFIFLKYFDKKHWSYLRITTFKSVKYFFSGIAMSFVVIIVFTLVNLILSNSELLINYNSLSDVMLYIIIIFIGVLATAAFEEIVFRGYVLKSFEMNFNIVTAIILSSLFFSAAHFFRPDASFLAFANIFLAGIVLSIICIYYNNLWAPLGIHFGWNYFLWLFNYPLSDNRWTNPLFKINYKSENLIIGSKFGPEDSILLTVLLVISIGYFLFKYRSKNRVTHINNM